MQKQRIASADPIDDYSDWRQSDWASEVNDGWFWQLIRGRRSVRRYLPDPVERSLLEKLLTAAIWALRPTTASPGVSALSLPTWLSRT